jgi:hypothetical protein
MPPRAPVRSATGFRPAGASRAAIRPHGVVWHAALDHGRWATRQQGDLVRHVHSSRLVDKALVFIRIAGRRSLSSSCWADRPPRTRRRGAACADYRPGRRRLSRPPHASSRPLLLRVSLAGSSAALNNLQISRVFRSVNTRLSSLSNCFNTRPAETYARLRSS